MISGFSSLTFWLIMPFRRTNKSKKKLRTETFLVTVSKISLNHQKTRKSKVLQLKKRAQHQVEVSYSPALKSNTTIDSLEHFLPRLTSSLDVAFAKKNLTNEKTEKRFCESIPTAADVVPLFFGDIVATLVDCCEEQDDKGSKHHDGNKCNNSRQTD